jgi:hypothetical protein
MRQRFVQVLQNGEDEAMTDIVLRFWTRAKPLPIRTSGRPDGSVVDLAHWIESHRGARR